MVIHGWFRDVQWNGRDRYDQNDCAIRSRAFKSSALFPGLCNLAQTDIDSLFSGMTCSLTKWWNTQRVNFRLCQKTQQYPGTGVKKIFPSFVLASPFFPQNTNHLTKSSERYRGAVWLSRSFPTGWIPLGAENHMAQGGFGVLYSWTWVSPWEYSCGRPIAQGGIHIPPWRLLVWVEL